MMAATNGGEVRKRERVRVVDRQREMVGILFCFTWVVVKCQLWLSEFGDFGWSCDMHMV